MASFNIVMPKLGESIIEATITRWIKSPGEQVNEDDPIVEIATDKVDSEIPSPVEGKLKQVFFPEGTIVAVGTVIAVIEVEGGDDPGPEAASNENPPAQVSKVLNEAIEVKNTDSEDFNQKATSSGRFYSPLVRSMAKQENIPLQELEAIAGSGKDGRLTKADLLNHIQVRTSVAIPAATAPPTPSTVAAPPRIDPGATGQSIPMDRMRKLIAEHMVMSVHTSPHVTSIVEVDMSRVVGWRETQKDTVLKRYNEKLTYTHVFIEAIARVIKEFPMVNASVSGDNILIKNEINIGMAVALPSGNLIVPVVRDADQKNLLGVIRSVNDLAARARDNKLLPDDVQGGTITLTNLGSFGTLMGTPIINQPQLAIVAVGAIVKRPVVLETEQGDVIGIRHMMYLSLSYDHRVIDGAMGGRFIYRLKEQLEHFDTNQII